jgi:hypothetical protein
MKPLKSIMRKFPNSSSKIKVNRPRSVRTRIGIRTPGRSRAESPLVSPYKGGFLFTYREIVWPSLPSNNRLSVCRRKPESLEETYAIRESCPLYHMRNGSDRESNPRPRLNYYIFIINTPETICIALQVRFKGYQIARERLTNQIFRSSSSASRLGTPVT